MKQQAKFTIANTLFFGVIGALIDGVMPTIYIAPSLYDSMMEKTDKLFTMYVFWSLTFGLIPALLTGFFYSRLYKREFLKNNEVKFGKELTLGLEVSFLVMFVIGLLIELFLFTFGLLGGSSISQLSNRFIDGVSILGYLSICGMIAGCVCANLMREWNQNLMATTINEG